MCLFSLSISSAWAYISLSDARRKRKLIQHSKKKKREREKGEREAAHSTWCILSPNGGHWFVFLKITFSFDQPGGRIDYSNIASLDKKKVDEKKHDKWRSRLSWTCDAAWYSNELCRGKIVGIIQATQTDGMFWQCLTKEKKNISWKFFKKLKFLKRFFFYSARTWWWWDFHRADVIYSGSSSLPLRSLSKNKNKTPIVLPRAPGKSLIDWWVSKNSKIKVFLFPFSSCRFPIIIFGESLRIPSCHVKCAFWRKVKGRPILRVSFFKLFNKK